MKSEACGNIELLFYFIERKLSPEKFENTCFEKLQLAVSGTEHGNDIGWTDTTPEKSLNQ